MCIEQSQPEEGLGKGADHHPAKEEGGGEAAARRIREEKAMKRSILERERERERDRESQEAIKCLSVTDCDDCPNGSDITRT